VCCRPTAACQQCPAATALQIAPQCPVPKHLFSQAHVLLERPRPVAVPLNLNFCGIPVSVAEWFPIFYRKHFLHMAHLQSFSCLLKLNCVHLVDLEPPKEKHLPLHTQVLP